MVVVFIEPKNLYITIFYISSKAGQCTEPECLVAAGMLAGNEDGQVLCIISLPIYFLILNFFIIILRQMVFSFIKISSGFKGVQGGPGPQAHTKEKCR